MNTLVRAIAWVLFFNAAIVAVLLVWEGWRRVSGSRRRDRGRAGAPAGISGVSAALEDRPRGPDRSAEKSLRAIRPRRHPIRLPGPGPKVDAIYRDGFSLPWRHR